MTDIKAGEGHFEENTELSFAEMLEESLKSLNTDEKERGVVVGIAPNEIQVDVGRKQAGFVPASELSSDPNAKPEDIVKIGDEIELLIMRTNDQEGTIMLSKKRLDAIKGWDVVAKAEEDAGSTAGSTPSSAASPSRVSDFLMLPHSTSWSISAWKLL